MFIRTWGCQRIRKVFLNKDRFRGGGRHNSLFHDLKMRKLRVCKCNKHIADFYIHNKLIRH